MARMKKILALTMAAAMGMSMLAGCGDKKDDGASEAASSTEVSEAASSEAAENTETGKTEAESSTEAETEAEALGVHDGDTVFELNFDDDDVDGCLTYFNGGQAELSVENGELCFDIKSTALI